MNQSSLPPSSQLSQLQKINIRQSEDSERGQLSIVQRSREIIPSSSGESIMKLINKQYAAAPDEIECLKNDIELYKGSNGATKDTMAKDAINWAHFHKFRGDLTTIALDKKITENKELKNEIVYVKAENKQLKDQYGELSEESKAKLNQSLKSQLVPISQDNSTDIMRELGEACLVMKQKLK
jgi:hypothetical protein